MTRLLLVLILLSVTAQAQVKYLEKGQPAPFTGYLFTPEQEQAARADVESLRYYKLVDDNNKKLFTLKDQESELLAKQSNMWKAQSESLSKQLESSRDDAFWRSTLYFGLGAVVTTLITFGVNQASK